MPDYRHPLEFGTFINPSNDPASTPVALAQLSERLNYDLVTFQDHPYQPAFLDTLPGSGHLLIVSPTVRC